MWQNKSDKITEKILNERLNSYINLANWLNLIYPIGAIYMSVISTNPSILFGGEWEQIQDTFLLAASSTYNAGDTGGSVTHTPEGTLSGGVVGDHTLTVAEMPSHGHQVRWWSDAGTLGTAYYYNGDTKTNVPYGIRVKGASGAWNNGSFTAAQSGAGDQMGGADKVGDSQSHNHPFTQPTFTGTAQDTMPPYLAVYMWKRTA